MTDTTHTALAGKGKRTTRKPPAKHGYSGSGQKPADKPGRIDAAPDRPLGRGNRKRQPYQEDDANDTLPDDEDEGGFDLELVAVEVLRGIMNNRKAMPVERIAAAKAVAQIEMRGGAGSGGAVSRLSRDEICAEIARTRQALDANTLKS